MNLPPNFCKQMQRLLGSEYDAFLSAIDDKEPVSLRLNPAKHNVSPSLPPVHWCTGGYYLNERPAFTFDPLFHAGAYYVQEASSMFLQQAIGQLITTPVKALDLCAAPGGKSTLLLSSLPQGSLLVANEVIRSRARILDENREKWGAANVVVSNNDPADFHRLPNYFDLIVADVPCSGEGMFRKDPQAIAEWSPENVSLCAARQRRIIKDVWPTLKQGGLMVYSTCTYNTHENEENIAWMCHELNAEPVALTINPTWNIGEALTGTAPCYRFFPHRTCGEGFFMAVLRKSGNDENDAPAKERGKAKAPAKNAHTFPHPAWLKQPEQFTFQVSESEVTAYPAALYNDMQALQAALKTLSAGLQVAERKGREWSPTHALALSVDFNRAAFPSVELDLETAIRYLRKEAVQLPHGTPTGYVLVLYKNVPLGWLKNIGNRSNNLYPQEYRIKTTYTPNPLTPLLP